jgi:glutaredoxin
MVILNGKEGKYQTTFVVNEIAKELSIRKDHENFEIKFDDALKNQEVTLFTKDNCDLCSETRNLLNSNKIKFQEISIEKDSTNLLMLVKEFKKTELKERAIVPVMKINDSLYTNLKNRNDLIKALKNHF